MCVGTNACWGGRPLRCRQGKDVIGLAETGSGKTGAFAVPILQALLENPQRLFAVVMAPTRELAFQINEVGRPCCLMHVCKLCRENGCHGCHAHKILLVSIWYGGGALSMRSLPRVRVRYGACRLSPNRPPAERNPRRKVSDGRVLCACLVLVIWLCSGDRLSHDRFEDNRRPLDVSHLRAPPLPAVPSRNVENKYYCRAALKVMEALGVGIGLKTVCIVGGIDMFQQVQQLIVVDGGSRARARRGGGGVGMVFAVS